MVTAVTNLGRSGLSDWLIQRFSALVLALYTFVIVGFLLMNPELTFSQWSDLFSQLWMKVFSLLTLVSIAAHGWIGLWGVLTDYVTNRMMGPKATVIRMIVLTVYGLVTITFLVWGIETLWGIV